MVTRQELERLADLLIDPSTNNPNSRASELKRELHSVRERAEQEHLENESLRKKVQLLQTTRQKPVRSGRPNTTGNRNMAIAMAVDDLHEEHSIVAEQYKLNAQAFRTALSRGRKARRKRNRTRLR